MDDLLKNKKTLNEFRKSLINTNKLIKKDTESIPNIDDINENNKGDWINHDQDDFKDIFNGLLSYCKDNEEEEFDNLDWNSVNFEIRGADWYEAKYPGFDPKVYDILAEASKDKVIDETEKEFKIEKTETIINFD
jgi:hypothetical protein